MIPGSTSRETVEFAAGRGYPYVALATRLEATDALFKAYDEIAEKHGHTPALGHRGYFTRVHVAPTGEQAPEEGREQLGGRVAQQLNELRVRFGVGHLGVSHFAVEDYGRTLRNIELLGNEVFPRLREMASED